MFKRVFIATHRHDIRYTRACAASVRFWNPSVEIWLIKDLVYGDFPTWDLTRSEGARVAPFTRRLHGWGFGKLEPLFHGWCGKFLVTDSDLLWMGDMQRALSDAGADFVVDEESPSIDLQRTNYFDPGEVSAFDPEFDWPRFSFNTGQWAGTAGVLKREDFESVLEWTAPPRTLWPGLFKLGEQGLQNYIFQKLAMRGRIRLERRPIMRVASVDEVAVLPPAAQAMTVDRGFLIHWCGLKSPRFGGMIRPDLWDLFNRRHYARVPGRRFLFLMREWAFLAERRIRGWARLFRNLSGGGTGGGKF